MFNIIDKENTERLLGTDFRSFISTKINKLTFQNNK